ncbi:hypothetical protein J437_LFUL013777 [Ladona fulva]|uniref:Secreted protein n=1 Tax=Ladona fulva TaxID=123851 RepID=A0A8K0KF36_LADFU|nr:hypothetical protein J437_LFUL013777 [Ladona fulva]
MNFPSRYLFAIRLVAIFNLRWSLPPALGCTLKQPDSEERTSYTVNPTGAWAWLHSWWCPSVNSFKFELCNHTSPGTQELWFPGSCPPSHIRNFGGWLAGIVYG